MDVSDEVTCNAPDADQMLLSSGHFQMPYDVVRDGKIIISLVWHGHHLVYNLSIERCIGNEGKHLR